MQTRRRYFRSCIGLAVVIAHYTLSGKRHVKQSRNFDRYASILRTHNRELYFVDLNISFHAKKKKTKTDARRIVNTM